ncbi:glycosyltransferase [Pseudoscardovia suis]
MKKVLEVFGEPIATGGQETFVFNNLKAMESDAFKFDFLTPYTCENNDRRKDIKRLGGNLYELKCPFRPGKSRRLIKKPVAAFFAQNKYDVVHIHSGSTSVLAIVSQIAKKAGTPKVIVHSHCALEKITLLNKINRRLCGMRMKGNVDLYCACSEGAALAKFCPEILPKVQIIRNGVDLGAYRRVDSIRQAIRKSLGAKETDFVIGHVGRMTYQKNQEYAISVFNELHSAKPNSQLWLIGDGPDYQTIKNRISELHLDNSVKLLGLIQDTSHYYQAFDAFIFPSRFEGLPISLIEAEAAGLPCIVSDRVSRESDLVGDFVDFLPLEDESTWISALESSADRYNENASEQLHDAGFSVTDSARTLEKMYLE